MKKLLYLLTSFFVILQFACFWDAKKSSNNKNLLLLMLLSLNSNLITVKTSSYNNAGTLLSYSENIYPSAAAYLQSQKTDINGQIFPTIYETMPLGGTTSMKMSSSIGTDGKWFTSDDTFGMYWELKVVSSTIARYIIYSNFVGTVSNYYEYQFDTNGRVIKRTYYNNAGVDSTWFTEDDVKSKDSNNVSILNVTWTDNNNCSAIGYDINGTSITQQFSTKRDTVANTVTYKSFQADGVTQVNAMLSDYTNKRGVIYSTSMSNITMYFIYVLNSFNEQRGTIMYGSAGIDTNWFTTDDVIVFYLESTYDASGNPTGSATYTDPSKTTRTSYSTVSY